MTKADDSDRPTTPDFDETWSLKKNSPLVNERDFREDLTHHARKTVQSHFKADAIDPGRQIIRVKHQGSRATTAGRFNKLTCKAEEHHGGVQISKRSLLPATDGIIALLASPKGKEGSRLACPLCLPHPSGRCL